MLEAAETAISDAGEALVSLGVAALSVTALIGLFYIAMRMIGAATDKLNESDRRLDRAQHAWMDQQYRKLDSHGYDSNAGPRGRLP